ncbi:unnamed protein product, partial [Polarella glacialis]
VPGRGHPSWPIQSQPGKAIFMDWGLHKEKNYQDRLNEITVLEMSTAITVDKMSVNNQELFRKARLMVSLAFGAYSDTPDMKAKARYGLPGWKVVAHEIQNTLEAKDSIWLVQEQDTMDCAFVFTGTSTFAELGTSIKSVGHPFCGFKEVHRGYQDKLYWLMKGLMPKLRPKMAQCNRMTCTGHSLGGSLCDVWSACANSKRTNDKHYKLQMWTKGDGAPGGELAPEEKAGASVSPEVALQKEYGAQSKRGGASLHPYKVLTGNEHAEKCFQWFGQNEARLCGEWATFYHSYSFAALIYEVHAAVGSVLFRFRSQYATLPRILVHEFNDIPDSPTLVKRFNEDFATNKRDHHPDYRKVGLSTMCSLASTGPEACTAMVFIAGYSCKDLSFRSVLDNLLVSCYVPKAKVPKLGDEIIAMAEKHGLDVSQFGGKACKSGKAGHLLQINIKRHLVDKLCYAAKPYGPVDDERMPISEWMNSNKSFQVGQARVVAHPKYFMQANSVRMFVASADPDFHRNRQAFQSELIQKLGLILGEPSLRERAATG